MHSRVCGVKLLSKIQKEDPVAAGGGLYLEIFNFSLGLQRPAEEKKKKMRELVSDQWAISKWVGSDTGLITGSILKVHTRQNYPACLNNLWLWARLTSVGRFMMFKSYYRGAE